MDRGDPVVGAQQFAHRTGPFVGSLMKQNLGDKKIKDLLRNEAHGHWVYVMVESAWHCFALRHAFFVGTRFMVKKTEILC